MNTSRSLIQQPVLSDDELHEIFMAKCQDYKLTPTPKSYARFKKHQTNSKQKTFSMISSSLGPLSASIVANIIFLHPNFKVISLSGNNFGNSGAEYIAELIRQTKTIISLDISSNSITDQGGAAIFNALQTNKTIVSLAVGSTSGVSRNSFGINTIKEMALMMSKNYVLSELNLSLTEISSEKRGKPQYQY